MVLHQVMNFVVLADFYQALKKDGNCSLYCLEILSEDCLGLLRCVLLNPLKENMKLSQKLHHVVLDLENSFRQFFVSRLENKRLVSVAQENAFGKELQKVGIINQANGLNERRCGTNLVNHINEND